jgi:hypothetical protein
MAKLFKRKGNMVIADRRDPHDYDGVCAFCSNYDELRPYGPNNEAICFDCAMKDEATAARKLSEMIDKAE